jgi:hypothetical protein
VRVSLTLARARSLSLSRGFAEKLNHSLRGLLLERYLIDAEYACVCVRAYDACQSHVMHTMHVRQYSVTYLLSVL